MRSPAGASQTIVERFVFHVAGAAAGAAAGTDFAAGAAPLIALLKATITLSEAPASLNRIRSSGVTRSEGPAAWIDETTLASGSLSVTIFKILSSPEAAGAAGLATAGLAGAGFGV